MIKHTLRFLLLTFCVNFTYADSFAQDTDMICKDYGNVQAIFEPNEHTCAPDYYMPANTDGCVACPVGYTCPGGTFAFDEFRSNGIYYTLPIMTHVQNGCKADLLGYINDVSQMNAVFEPNEHTCAPGYYMPANTDGCVICPANSYCYGGTYTFNEDLTQGIIACADGLSAPNGMWESSQCGRILHIGEHVVYTRTTKKTYPSLHFNIDGVIYYANATTSNVPMNSDTHKRFKIKHDDTIYYVYDDTIKID